MKFELQFLLEESRSKKSVRRAGDKLVSVKELYHRNNGPIKTPFLLIKMNPQ